MSNLDYDDGEFNPVDFISAERRRVMGTAVGDLEADPEKAARAIQLSQATGVPAPIIAGDQDNFEQQHKTALTSSLLTNNEYLRSYIASNPMAGKVSNDDYGQLDAASQSVSKLDELPFHRRLAFAISRGIEDSLGSTIEGMGGPKGFTDRFKTMGKQKTLEAVGEDEAMALEGSLDTFTGKFGQAAGGLVPMLAAAVAGGLPGAALQSAFATAQQFQEGAELAGASENTKGAAYTAGFAIGTVFGALPIHVLQRDGIAVKGVGTWTVDRAWQAVQMAGLMGVIGEGQEASSKLVQRMLYDPHAEYTFDEERLAISMILGGFMGASFGKVKPFVDSGKPIPAGLDPVTDGMKVNEAKSDGDSLKEALKESSASSTRERAPDLYADFVRQHTGNREIGISPDAVRKLYGEKLPEPDDGILGWVPDLAAKLERAEATGMDVQVPVADWLAKVEPEVAKELHDFIRVRDGGVTIEEGKVVKASAMVEAYHGSPHDFDAFSMEKIGTGEGAQSYGHGLYFAENPEVAKAYELAGAREQMVNGKRFNANNPEHLAAFELHRYGNPNEAIAQLTNRYKRLETQDDVMTTGERQKLVQTIKLIEKGDVGKYTLGPEKGNQFRVRIHANKEDMLDWDKPYEQQPPKVQDALRQIMESNPEIGQRFLSLTEGGYGAKANPNPTGAELYSVLGRGLTKGNAGREGDRGASKALHQAGIPGIKYLDQGSRGPSVREVRLKELLEREKDTGLEKEQYRQELQRELDEIQSKGLSSNFVIFDDSLIEITHKNNEAVQSVRRSSGLEHPLADLYGAEDFVYGENITAKIKPKELYTAHELELERAVKEEMDRILPKGGMETQSTHEITMDGENPNGVHMMFDKRMPIALYSLTVDDPVGVARHEVIHHLRGQGFFSKDEWSTLAYAAIEQGWIKKYDINDRYSKLSSVAKVEEAVAEAFREWRRVGDKGVPSADRAIFRKMEMVIRAIQRAFAKAFGKEKAPTWQELFDRADEGEIGSREGTQPIVEGAQASAMQGELDVTRMEDKAVFDKAAAIGMTVDQYRRYMNLIEARRIEDMEADLKRATKAEEKRQSKEWKENKAEMRTEVAEHMAQRPDIQALRFVEDKKINLTPEIANSLAEYFGYQTGAEMMQRVGELREQRKASGLNAYEFTRRLIDVETDRRMEQRYGDLGENILKEAKDQVLSETQLDLLHEETVALAEQAKTQLPIPKEELKKQILENIQDMEVRNLTSDKLLEAAGRAGRDTEMALLKGDPTEAFRQKQRQFIAVTMAKEAMKIEADVARLDKLAKKYEGRDLPKIDPAAAAYTQQLLQQAGYKVKLMPQEIAREIEAHGHGSLGDYTQHLVDFGWEPNLTEDILSRGGKPMEQAKVSEFYELKDAADSLDFIGRNIMKIDLAGEKLDYKDWKATTLEKIRSMPVRDISKAEAGGKEGNWLYRLDAPLTRMEEIVKDLDLREELGPLYKALIVPFELSKAKSYNMLNELSKEIKSINGFNKKWRRSLEDNIPNDFVYDTYNETLFKLNRWNMVKMMLNWGNESNALKMVDGIARAGGEVKPSKEVLNHIHARLEDMFAQHATPEDWNFVKKIWSVFDGYKGEVETMNRNLGGKIPKWIEGRDIETPDGTIKGGYFPLIPDRNRNLGPISEGKKLTGTGPLGQDYFRATTNQKYLEQRTGARYFVDITNGPEQLIGRLQQVIHDISYRDFVKTAGQVIYDKEIKAAIRKHYGPEYAAQMEPWLKRIANQVTVNEAELQGFNDILGKARLNLVAAALPLNYTVMLSPSMGTLNLKQMALFNADRTANKAMVMEHSKEIQHMLYSLDRDVNQALRTQLGKQGWTAFQLKAMEWMFKPLLAAEQEFRMTTFYGEFMKQKAAGKSDFDAGLISDSLIRERHGSQHVGDLPALMASSNEFLKMSTVFMGYFSTQRNWMRQIPGQVRAGDMSAVAKTLWGTMGVATIMNAALFTKQKQDEGFFHWISRAVLSTPLQMIPFVRDMWNYATEGFQPTSPIMGLMTGTYELIKDGIKLSKGGQPKNPIKHAFNTAGTVFGVPGAMQMGRTAEFLKDVQTREQRPRDIVEWMRGITTGEAKKRK